VQVWLGGGVSDIPSVTTGADGRYEFAPDAGTWRLSLFRPMTWPPTHTELPDFVSLISDPLELGGPRTLDTTLPVTTLDVAAYGADGTPLGGGVTVQSGSDRPTTVEIAPGVAATGTSYVNRPLDLSGPAPAPTLPTVAGSVSLSLTGVASVVPLMLGSVAVAAPTRLLVAIAAGFTPDTSPPAIAPTYSAAPTADGWYAGAVTVSFTCTDGGSGVATCPGPVTLAEGAGRSVTVTATDLVGNASHLTVTANVDATPPTISGAAPASASGWYRGDVTVAFTCADALSGVAACTTSSVVTGEGRGLTASGTAADRAGLTAATTVVGINIDRTPPHLDPTLPTAPSGWYPGNVTVGWVCSDQLSGLDSCPQATTINGEGTGLTATATASDRAGNTTTGTATVAIDRTAPTVTVDPTVDGHARRGTPLTGRASDALSGVATVTVRYVPARPGGATVTTTGTVSCDAARRVCTWSASPPTTAGRYRVEATASDLTAHPSVIATADIVVG
jgi:hypothetical protein